MRSKFYLKKVDIENINSNNDIVISLNNGLIYDLSLLNETERFDSFDGHVNYIASIIKKVFSNINIFYKNESDKSFIISNKYEPIMIIKLK